MTDYFLPIRYHALTPFLLKPVVTMYQGVKGQGWFSIIAHIERKHFNRALSVHEILVQPFFVERAENLIISDKLRELLIVDTSPEDYSSRWWDTRRYPAEKMRPSSPITTQGHFQDQINRYIKFPYWPYVYLLNHHFCINGKIMK